MRVEIARLHRRLGTTMVYVTHDQIEAMTLGQRIVVFNAVRSSRIDTPMRLYRRPANVFVAGFLGSPRDELLRGTLEQRDGLVLAGAGTESPLGDTPALAAALAPWIGRTAGRRPAAGESAARRCQCAATDVPARASGRGEPVGSEVSSPFATGTRSWSHACRPRPGSSRATH
jgi:multiple sugar transport system ATP-binding protein